MNRGALVRLVVSLALASPALAQTPVDKRLALSIRFDDAKEASQRVQTTDGVPAIVFIKSPRPVQERQYIPTPAGVIPQQVTTVQESTAAIEVTPRLVADRVELEVAKRKVAGRLGEWVELGAIAVSPGGETRRVWAKVDEVP